MRWRFVILWVPVGFAFLGLAPSSADEGPLQFDPAAGRPTEQDRLFTDPPGDTEARRSVLNEVRTAADKERSAIIAFLSSCIAYDHDAYRGGRAAAQYQGNCRRALDAWRLSHGQANPRRELDRQVAAFRKIVGWMTISATRIDQAACARFNACSPEALGLFAVTNPADLDRLSAENHVNFARSQRFVEGLIEIVQETR